MKAKSSDTAKTITATLSIDSGGESVVRSRFGLQGESPKSLDQVAQQFAVSKTAPKKAPAFDVAFNSNYDDRQGFNEKFLDPRRPALAVHLPKPSAALAKQTAKLTEPSARNRDVLHYHGYSLVMHDTRRFAIYSAANVDFSGRYELARPADVWRADPRISAQAQVTEFYYAKNQFDRGHLTRREDMEYGPTRRAALTTAADTCHWTNCTPQHARFNESKELWQGIERHIFEDAVERDQFRAQVITGPILGSSDPVWAQYPKIQYPLRFWKVVAAVTASGKLFATAYILDQSGVIDKFGVEAAVAVPFTAYKTFQVPISEVERLTGLSFSGGPSTKPFALSTVDPLAKRSAKKVRGFAVREAALVGSSQGWLPLESLDAMVLPD